MKIVIKNADREPTLPELVMKSGATAGEIQISVFHGMKETGVIVRVNEVQRALIALTG